jgi:hypothetical protein
MFSLAAASVMVAVGSAATAQQFVTKAPTPADWAALAKLPDFNGVWERGGGGGGGGAARGGGGAARGDATPARGAAGAAPRGNAAGGRGAAGAGAGGGQRGGRGGGMQLTPKAEALRAAYRAPEDGETANCLPPGMPGIMTQPYPMEFLLTPGKVTIIIEAYTQVRHIYTDGRPLPADPNPEFHGTSIGRWENDTLVVDTIGFSPLTRITGGVPPSDKMRIVERFRLTAPDTMSIETTITDPENLAAPYTTTSTLRRHRDWTITEYICEENNRNSVDAKGKAGIDLTVPTSPR